MITGFSVAVSLLLCLLALAAYVDRIYFEMGKFLSREYTENIEAWEQSVEPKLRLSRESAALSASVLRQIALEIMRFDRAAGCSVFWIEVQHDPLSLEIMQADLAPILGWQREIRSGLASLRYGVRGKQGCG